MHTILPKIDKSRSEEVTLQALTQYRKALAAHPFDVECLRQLSTVCREQGNMAQNCMSFFSVLAEYISCRWEQKPLCFPA